MQVATRAQRLALCKLFNRLSADQKLTFGVSPYAQYRAFRRGFHHCIGDYLGGPWCGMFIGIERDGYTHS